MSNFYTEVIQKDPRFRSTTRISDPALLESVTRAAVSAIIADASALNISLMIWETYRSSARQEFLFNTKKTQLRRVGVHGYGLAADLVKNVSGQPSWEGDFTFLADLAKKHGLIWGGNWNLPPPHKLIDSVHVQRIAVADQKKLFSGNWYPSDSYNPYVIAKPPIL